MCGIVGFTGNRQAAPILLDGLSKLEYRGYDSAGLAVRDGDALAQVVKAKGPSFESGRENGQWKCVERNLWYWTYPLGNPWRTQSDQCPSPCLRQLQQIRFRCGRIGSGRRT